MTPPESLLHLEWVEAFRDKPMEKRYRNRAACARQVAAILAAPDAIARMKGLWLTAGWRDSRLGWEELDPVEFLASVDEATVDSDVLTDEIGVVEKYERIAQAWSEYDERSRT